MIIPKRYCQCGEDISHRNAKTKWCLNCSTPAKRRKAEVIFINQQKEKRHEVIS